MQIVNVLETFNLSRESLEEIVNILVSDFTKGLSADERVRAESPVKMLPTYVRAIPDRTEEGSFLALDLGGSNFRVLLITIDQGTVYMESELYPLDKALMTSDAITLFDYIADSIALFVKKQGVGSKHLPLGFTFSFPVQQLSLTSGLLIKWTKGFSAAGVENKDVVKLLREAIVRKGVVSLYILRKGCEFLIYMYQSMSFGHN